MANQNDNHANVIQFTGAPPNGARRVDPHTARILAGHERQMAMLRFLRDVVVAGPALLLRWYRRNALYRELAALPDSMLDDIGLERGQIADVVYGRRSQGARPDLGGGAPVPAPGPTTGPTTGPAKPETTPETPIAA